MVYDTPRTPYFSFEKRHDLTDIETGQAIEKRHDLTDTETGQAIDVVVMNIEY